eukprot:scaffold16.g52.t1
MGGHEHKHANTRVAHACAAPQAIEALYASQHPRQRELYAAMYSSELGGVVTDPALMVVQIDDHMVHRGHAVFDTTILVDGHLYQLSRHLQRFLTSAAKASIPLPTRLTVEQLYRTVLETAAASKLTDGYLRYYLSAGRSGFGLSSVECASSAFYCFVQRLPEKSEEQATEYLRGWRVKTTPVPHKPAFFATLKSTSYLSNALAVLDAQAEGFDQVRELCVRLARLEERGALGERAVGAWAAWVGRGIFVDEGGFVCGGPNTNLAALLPDGTLVVPPFERSLAGMTMRRVMELVPQVRALLDGDMRPRPTSDQHVPVPYGFLTDMGLFFAAQQLRLDVLGTCLGSLIYLRSLWGLGRPDLMVAAVACAAASAWPLTLSTLCRGWYLDRRDWLFAAHNFFHHVVGAQLARYVRLNHLIDHRQSPLLFLASHFLSSTVIWQCLNALVYRLRLRYFLVLQPLSLLASLRLEARLCADACAAFPAAAPAFSALAEAARVVLSLPAPLPLHLAANGGGGGGGGAPLAACVKLHAFLLGALAFAVPVGVLFLLEQDSRRKFARLARRGGGRGSGPPPRGPPRPPDRPWAPEGEVRKAQCARVAGALLLGVPAVWHAVETLLSF